MHTIILWVGFLGGWLLVAGPVFQAAVELRDEEIDRESMAAAHESVPEPRRISPWWWLLPPVAYLRIRRDQREYRRVIFDAMPLATRRQFASFVDKATGWMFVAGGAALIALKETWELVEHYEWPLWVWIVLVLVMAALAVVNTAVRMARTRELVGES
ncbi:hypothetical protein [Schumannella sp. 10F1B-5-1]|uniref:hypothetical protein n=1 Tax=Schumannella sp. 10F1B-5-1 TaxID=2590780 RepID=UPI001130C28E|nr:hypothetical protein [Schumannella sp. 10F1B-5-1]TPW72803.1 hypothetical protein FJ658_05915 [Schumannella sp. 10F1B-5-1]